MEKTIRNTPIDNLIKFLNSVKSFNDRGDVRKNLIEQGISVGDSFCIVLKIEKKELFNTLSGYLQLITLIKSQVEMNFKNNDRYLAQLEDVEKALISVGLDNDITVFKKYLTEKVITTLELCADGLAEKEDINIVPNDVLDNIEDDIIDMKKILEHSKLPKSVILVLLQKLDEVENAIRQYKRWGINDFDRVYDSLLGGLYKNRKEINLEENKSLIEKMNSFMLSLLTTTKTSKEILDTTKQLRDTVIRFLE
ncbi:hypothetical protein ABER61_15480 [Brevibacillus formosus]|uniref:Uncharacterized protein n=1 Tax=Brevibacillus formosus TaxID=54913 RepID=A0A837KN03_9BACL|nr:hypothetical protein [Brevibacillus formosus]KLH98874.1 hypothetical protein AA984_10090 [Brevibacillus formosus]MED1958178.1 hypothetical protein [Brevibacillus formosus]PSJ93574.1 hypothetical protein C7R91_20115 [Brevibacillus formosus]GED59505.1 hypothetical protein BFO01nite_36370 [Brevibacillus formosus]